MPTVINITAFYHKVWVLIFMSSPLSELTLYCITLVHCPHPVVYCPAFEKFYSKEKIADIIYYCVQYFINIHS